MSGEIRHDPDSHDALAQEFQSHRDSLRQAGERRRRTAARLQSQSGRHPIATAVSHSSTEIMRAIKKAEDELHRHLGDVSHGLQQMSRNHHENDAELAKAITKLQSLEKKAAEVHAHRGPEAQGPNHSLPSHTITLEWQEGMPKLEFARKALALRRLGNQGKLFRGPKVVRQDGLTDAYKNALVKMIYAQNKDNKSLAKAATDRVTNKHVVGNQSDRGSGALQPDHINELQLGGMDRGANLDMLDGFTNWHIGTQQVTPALRKLPVGTPIKIKIKWW